MPFVLRQSQDEENPRLPDAYGKQITAGRLVYYDESAPRRFLVFLCRGGEYGCEGVESVYYHGSEIAQFAGAGNTNPNWVFHPGTVTKQIDPAVFTADSKTDRLECTTQVFHDDDPVRIRAIDGEVPGGLSGESKKYVVINAGGNTFQLREEFNTEPVPLTSDGSGTLLIWKADAGFDDPIQGKPKLFPEIEYTFSGICYIEGRLPADVGPQTGEPDGFKFVINCRKIADYNSVGIETGTPGLSANNARVAADILLKELKLPTSRIDWQSWYELKTVCDEMIWHRTNSISSFTTGTGLTGEYYNHADMGFGAPSFATASFVRKRGGEEINFNWEAQSPALGVNTDWFLVRWRGKVRPAFSELYTFQTTADDGVRLWVRDCEDTDTPIIDRWNTAIGTNSAQIQLTKNELVDIRLEFYEAEEGAHIYLRWFSQSHPTQIIPKSRLYPADHPVKRYEAHLAIPAAMTAWQAFEEVIERAPGWHWQDINGKITFLGPDRELAHEFVYDPDSESAGFNIASKTFEASPRVPEDRSNYQRYEFRDVETEGYAQSYLEVHREQLRERQGGQPSDTPLVRLGVMSRSLAERIAETRMRLFSDPERQFVLRGQLDSYKVSKGDRVKLSHFLSGDTLSDPVECLVTAETTGGNADEKTYTLLPITFPFYEDEEVN